MVNKLTPEEIKKALECCGDTDDGCLHCPLYGSPAPECGMRLCRESLELHNSQQAEIENCYKFIEQLKEARNLWEDKSKEQPAEIERLERELDVALENDPSKTYPYEVITPYGVVFSKCEKGYEDFKMDIKSQAIKEFAERLKNSLKGYGGLYCRTTMNVRIDNLVKEMVGK